MDTPEMETWQAYPDHQVNLDQINKRNWVQKTSQAGWCSILNTV